MRDVLDAIIRPGLIPEDEDVMKEEVFQHTQALSGVRSGARTLVREVEAAVLERPDKIFSIGSGNNANLTYKGLQWNAGAFETVSIANLRRRISDRVEGGTGQIRLFLLDGISPMTDIGSLQATCGADTLFQVASQFNCLEAVGAFVAPVASYFNDPTQGPRASISAFPATLLRHYYAPDEIGNRFVQSTTGRQLNLLEDACDSACVKSGYLTGADIDDPEKLVTQLEENFDDIRVGVHDNVEVVFGYNWDGSVDSELSKPIAQVFTSTIAGGGYGGERLLPMTFHNICQRLLRAAYLGTLLSAVMLRKKRVVLTLIGGGVFRNRFEDIWAAILWAVKEVQPLLIDDIDVIVNGYDIEKTVDISKVVQPDVHRWNGRIATFDEGGLVRIA